MRDDDTELDDFAEGPSKTEIKCVDNKDGTCTVSYLYCYLCVTCVAVYRWTVASG